MSARDKYINLLCVYDYEHGKAWYRVEHAVETAYVTEAVY